MKDEEQKKQSNLVWHHSGTGQPDRGRKHGSRKESFDSSSGKSSAGEDKASVIPRFQLAVPEEDASDEQAVHSGYVQLHAPASAGFPIAGEDVPESRACPERTGTFPFTDSSAFGLGKIILDNLVRFMGDLHDHLCWIFYRPQIHVHRSSRHHYDRVYVMCRQTNNGIEIIQKVIS